MCYCFLKFNHEKDCGSFLLTLCVYEICRTAFFFQKSEATLLQLVLILSASLVSEKMFKFVQLRHKKSIKQPEANSVGA